MARPRTLTELQGHYEIPDLLRIDAGQGGLTRLVLTPPGAEAHVYLHGAHVTHFKPAGQRPALFMSGRSSFEAGKPIRGGVPVVFPWFGPRQDAPDAPLHGFARLIEWGLESVEQQPDGAIQLTFDLADHDATRAHWPEPFELRYRVTVGASLALELEVRNPGPSPIRFEEALHTYFQVGDVRKAEVEGLAGGEYLDKTQDMKRLRQEDDRVRITGETDRVYLATRSTCILHDHAWHRRIRIDKSGSDATVVWNPWQNKARAMPDFDDEEWPDMLCIETCNVGEHAVELPPDQMHRMQATIHIESERR